MGAYPISWRTNPFAAADRLQGVVSLLLLISCLSLSISVFADGHWVDPDPHNDSSLQGHGHGGDDAEEAGCDHCCHGASHLLGLSLVPGAEAVRAGSRPSVRCALCPDSLSLSPPMRPPAVGS